MITYRKETLDNGLKIIIHEDRSTPFIAVNTLYGVGSKNEDPGRTGFAHLFEHLMFGGSVNIPEFDTPLQKAGGDSNAFTNPDITNYFNTLPASNLETALWLESDRMLQLDFSQESLDVQKSVVIEEFKENYINQPYGNVWHHLLDLSYKKHPYRWPTIGLTPQHVKDATLDDVKSFFYDHYRPNNATLVVAGNVSFDKVMRLVDKWFADIPSSDIPAPAYKHEEPQNEARFKEVEENVPIPALYKTFHMGARMDEEYYASDLLTDLLSSGASSRMNQELVKEKKIFSSANAYISDSIDPGLIIAEGKINPKFSIEEADDALSSLLYSFVDEVSDKELDKVKNKVESSIGFSKVELLTRAMNIAYFDHLGDPEMINNEEKLYRNVSIDDIRSAAKKIFRKDNCSTLYYKAK
ncbi:MAG: insulinase family protein [Chitinophagales bacterium]|nr:insulinase family protein [Chitinophagales bacterium]